MNVEIGTEDVQFLEKEYINGIFVAVHATGGELKTALLVLLPRSKQTYLILLFYPNCCLYSWKKDLAVNYLLFTGYCWLLTCWLFTVYCYDPMDTLLLSRTHPESEKKGWFHYLQSTDLAIVIFENWLSDDLLLSANAVYLLCSFHLSTNHVPSLSFSSS